MGGQASSKMSVPTASAAEEKALMQRLGALQMRSVQRDCIEEDFVRVDNTNEKAASSGEARLALARRRQPEGLEVDAMADWQKTMLEDPKNQLALAALSSGDPKTVLMSRAAKISDQHVFNVRIPFEGAPITNQRRSGRCWLFASTNTFRVALMKKYELESFELSQAYLFFWDKLEKANYFLENIIQTAGEDLEGRLVQRLLADPVSDGGQWDMVYNLVDKYGLVPQALYPDSFNAMSSSSLNYVVVAKLREFAVTLRNIVNGNGRSSDGDVTVALADAKAKMMREIQLILTVTLGPPPSSTDAFTWDYLDKHGKAQTLHKTPLDFARDISSPSSSIRIFSAEAIKNLVSLVHDPRHDPLTLMTVDRLGNVVGGRGITYINVSMPTLKQACVATLKAGIPIFFGSDVGKFSNTAAGIMDIDLIDYRLGFNTDILGPEGSNRLSKADRLRTGESAMTHAMVLTAVHVDDKSGQTVRWRVQNSWGEDAGDKGWFVMSDAWMDEFVYQAVIHPRFLSKEVRSVLDKEPIVLPLWDPMGALA